MSLLARVRSFAGSLGRVEKLFLASLVLLLGVQLLAPGSAILPLLFLLAYFFGAWACIRLARRLTRRAIWRLRNRLLVAYVFIAVIPVALILILAGLGVWIGSTQVAVYLVTSELDRRTSSLQASAHWLAGLPPKEREDSIGQMAPNYTDRFPGLVVLIRDARGERRYPAEAPGGKPEGWGEAHGVLIRESRLYAWGRAVRQDAEVTFLCPLTVDYLSGIVPGLGSVDFLEDAVETAAKGPAETDPIPGMRLKVGKKRLVTSEARKDSSKSYLPPPAGAWDRELIWMALVPAARWEAPGQTDTVVLAVRSRPSAVFRTISGNTAGLGQSLLPSLFLVVVILFLIVEIISLVIGISLSRTITAAVNGLYEATLRVKEADFGHRIQVRGTDQLADLSDSFNSMTENLHRLLAVEKEKERLQSELEIAREVQYQLYPRAVPALRTLSLVACCNPARMVSGDYYDYQSIGDSKIALAIGDVAGKGISAALLMATVESSVRTQLRHCLEIAAAAGGGNGSPREMVSTSGLVAQLNQHLYAHTSPEKYATFCFGVYDEASGLFTYTNAGHLPPILIRGGEARQLEVNGMVVGAFPFAEYGESRVPLEPGDLLVCYTDGVTEPENEYGEMFGEERLIDVLVKNWSRDPEEIVASVTQSVRQWTGSPELQDDMTLLLARRA